MRWWIVAVLFLAACTQVIVDAPRDTGFVVFERDIPKETQYLFPDAIEQPALPNYSEDRADDRELSCQTWGCDPSTQIVAYRRTRTFFSCDCESIEEIPFEEIECLRDFSHALELKYTRDPSCA